jgi:hypothetical protein
LGFAFALLICEIFAMTYLLPLAAADRTATLWLLACGGSTLVATLEGKTECIKKGTALLIADC